MGQPPRKQRMRQDPGPSPAEKPVTHHSHPMEGALNLIPVPIWIEDFSGVKARVDHIRSGGVDDLEKYFDRRPQEVLALAGLVRTTWLNDAALRYHEAEDSSTFIGNLHRISGKESYGVFKEEVLALVKGQPDFFREFATRTASGDTKHFLLHARVDPACGHDLSRVYVAVTDITPIREAEEDLKNSEATYRQVFETAVNPTVMIDSRTEIIVDASRSAQQLLGYPAEEFVGASIDHFCPEDCAKSCAEALDSVVRGRQSLVEDLRLRRKDGTEVHVAVNARAVHAGSRSGVVLVFFPAGSAVLAWDRRMKVDRRASSDLRRKLSERERQVLALIASGHTNQAIADRLSISRKTVETHRLRLMQKLDIHKATDLVRFALTAGLSSTA